MNQEQIAFLEGQLTAITWWLEENQPDVFRRGIWDAINRAEIDYPNPATQPEVTKPAQDLGAAILAIAEPVPDLPDVGITCYRNGFNAALKAAAALASPAPIQQDPCATFEGYLDGGTPIIKWTGPALPAGAKLYAAPPALAGSQVQAVGEAVDAWNDALEKAAMMAETQVGDFTIVERAILRGAATAIRTLKFKPNADCSGDPANCPDNEGYGCACDPMNRTTQEEQINFESAWPEIAKRGGSHGWRGVAWAAWLARAAKA